MIGTQRRVPGQESRLSSGRTLTPLGAPATPTRTGTVPGMSESDVNALRVQMAETLGDVLSVHTETSRELLQFLRQERPRKMRVDYFRSTATTDTPAGTGLAVQFPQNWLPSVAVISTIIWGVGGSAGATLQIGRRIYTPNVGAALPNPASLPLGDDVGIIVFPQDLVKLSVPTTPVVLSLEMVGRLLEPWEAERIQSG